MNPKPQREGEIEKILESKRLPSSSRTYGS
jgi:hypothetical protein